MKKPLFDAISSLRNYTLLGVTRKLLLKLRRKVVIVEGSCLQCGCCCKRINLEGRRGWMRHEKEFLAVLEQYPEYKRFKIDGKDLSGYLLFSCGSLSQSETCTDYENRPQLCKKFPAKELFFSGGQLPAGCGYHFRVIRSFAPFLKKAVRSFDNENSRS